MDRLFSALLVITVVLTVFSLGLVIRLRTVVGSLRRGWPVTALAVTNVLVVPALGWCIAVALRVGDAERVGLLLVFAGAGGAIALKLVQLVPGTDLALALSMTVLLEIATIASLPLWASAVAPSSPVDGRAALSTVILLVLLPLFAGAITTRSTRGASQRFAPPLGQLATVGLALVVISGLIAFRRELGEAVMSRTTVAALAAGVLSLGLGAVVGRLFRIHVATSALITACRFSSLGLVVVDRAFTGRDDVHAAAIVVALILLLVPTGVTAAIRARDSLRLLRRPVRRSRPIGEDGSL